VDLYRLAWEHEVAEGGWLRIQGLESFEGMDSSRRKTNEGLLARRAIAQLFSSKGGLAASTVQVSDLKHDVWLAGYFFNLPIEPNPTPKRK
jgi:hypothetical protein